jgi:RHS repeat-associated protein
VVEGVRRHDYLPFGEENVYNAAGGSRTAANGYVADGVRQQFTGHERDAETGLDFMQARYYASGQGRFTSIDPLLSSGDIYTAQSWNRYAYAFNNPLRFIDPFGLYNWDASAGGSFTDDELRTRSKDKALSRRERKDAKKALEFRSKFRNALDQARQAAGSSRLNSDESQSVASAANSYGTVNDDNGVIVGRRSGGGPGSSWLNDNDTINVVFRDNLKKNDLVTVITHEGQHVADAQAFLESPIANSWTDLTHYEREERAYYTGAYIARALNMKNYPAKADIKVWERGWKEADRATKMSRAVEAYIHRGYSGLSPANPGDRYSEEYKGRRVP